MGITIAPSSLASRIVRKEITGRLGERIIDTSLSFSDTKTEGEGLVSRFIDGLQQYGGFLLSQAKQIVKFGLRAINLSRVWGWLVARVQRLAVFDWNQTDAELAQLMANNNLSVFATWGGALGAGLGWMTGVGFGYAVGFAVPVIGGAALARTIASRTSLEGIEELQGYLRSAFNQTVSSAASNLLINQYINVRRFFKVAPRETLVKFFGENVADWIKTRWGAEGAPQFSFASTVENVIDSVGWDPLRVFLENGVDEFVDSFIESGFIVANELDAAYQQYKMQNERNGASTSRAVTIIPDKKEPNERFYVEGTETEVKQQAQAIITNARVLGNRDLGEWVGQPTEDYVRARPHRRKATILFKEIAGKGFYFPDGKKARSATYTIPDLKSAISWERLKLAVKPYNWGEYRATANLTSGRQMAVYGATEQEAREKLEDLIELSTAEILSLSISQEKDRDIRLRKHITRMYPYRMKLLVRRFDPDGSSLIDLEGNAYSETRLTVPIWQDEEPAEYETALI